VVGSAGTVSVINLVTQTQTTTISVTHGRGIPYGALSVDGSFLYVTGGFSGGNPVVSVISTSSNTVIATPQIGDSYAITTFTTSSGTVDSTFGNNGFTLTPVSRADTVQGTAIHAAPHDTNEILMTGSTFASNTSSLFLSQFTVSGSLDTSGFNSGGSTPGYQTLLPTGAFACMGNAVTTDANGNVLVAGYSAQNPTAMVLARYTSAGALDTAFPNGSGPGYTTLTIGAGFTANAIGLQSSGDIIVAGTSVVNGIPLFTIARFTSTGVLDTSFGPSSTGYVTSSFGNISILKGMAIPGTSSSYEDNIFAVGAVDNQMLIAQYSASGTFIQSRSQPFNTARIKLSPSSSIGYAVVWDPNTTGGGHDTLYIAGSVTIGGILQAIICSYQPALNQINQNFNGFNGVVGYNTLSVGLGAEYYSIAIQPDGNIITGGYAIGSLGYQLLLSSYVSFFGSTFPTWGLANPLFNNNNPQLTTIGSSTAAQGVGIQSTGNIITAGTSDGTFCVARFNG
jgi:uncharacterized delta-60 repeat protein